MKRKQEEEVRAREAHGREQRNKEAEQRKKEAEVQRKKEQEAEERSRLAAEKARQRQEEAARERLYRQQAEEAAQRVAEAARKEQERLHQQLEEMERLICKFREMENGQWGKEPGMAHSKSTKRTCYHDRWWPRAYGASMCEFCEKDFPIYTLRCPDCEVRACVPCKMREARG